MISVADVARELHLPEGEVLDVCRDLGIVASSSASGLSSVEHRQLRDHFGGDDAELGALPRGSTERRPGEHGHPHEYDHPGDDDLDVDGPAAPPTGAADQHHHTHHPASEPGTWDTVVAARKKTRKPEPAADAVRLPFHRSVKSRTVVRVSVLLFGVIALGISLIGLANRADDAGIAGADASCVDFVDGTTVTVPVDCDAPHDAQVVSVITLDDGDAPHPGAEELLARAEARCPDGGDVDPPTGDVVGVFLVPTPASWDDGDRVIVCLLEDASAPLVGPLELP